MIQDYEIPQCPICFEALMDNLSVTKCGHVFHKKCIEEALTRKNLCPLDRVECKIDQLRSLSYNVSVQENRQVKEYFENLTDDEKSSIGKLSLKLHTVLKEKQTLIQKCTGQQTALEEVNKEILKYKEVESDNIDLILKQKNKISAQRASVMKCELMVEDSERMVANIELKNTELVNKNKELISTNDVLNMIEKFNNKRQSNNLNQTSSSSVSWASQIRQTQPLQEQAQIFYEAYRIILVKEDNYKERIERLRTENERLQKFKMAAVGDHSYLKKKYQNCVDKNKILKNEIEKLYAKIQEVNTFTTDKNENSLEINSKNSDNFMNDEYSQKTTKKRKLNDLVAQQMMDQKNIISTKNIQQNRTSSNSEGNKNQNPFVKPAKFSFGIGSGIGQKNLQDKQLLRNQFNQQQIHNQKQTVQRQQLAKQGSLGGFLKK